MLIAQVRYYIIKTLDIKMSKTQSYFCFSGLLGGCFGRRTPTGTVLLGERVESGRLLVGQGLGRA